MESLFKNLGYNIELKTFNLLHIHLSKLSKDEWLDMPCIVLHESDDAYKLYRHLSDVNNFDDIKSISFYTRDTYNYFASGDIRLMHDLYTGLYFDKHMFKSINVDK